MLVWEYEPCACWGMPDMPGIWCMPGICACACCAAGSSAPNCVHEEGTLHALLLISKETVSLELSKLRAHL